MSLPSNYKRVEYIESTGTQYIDTNVVDNFGISIIVELTPTYLSSDGFLLGTYISSHQKGIQLEHSSSNGTRVSYGETFYATNNFLNIGTKYLINISKNKLIINGTQYEYTGTSGSLGTKNLFLFWDNGASQSLSFTICKYKIHKCQIFNNDILIRDFIPAERNDNVLGLYDLVNNVFYTNNGSGTFNKGSYVYEINSDVNPQGSGTIQGLGTYVSGQQATITAIANSGYEFENWLLKGYTQLEYIESTGSQWIE